MTRARPIATVMALLFAAFAIAATALGVAGCDDAPCVRHSDCDEGFVCGPLNRCIVAPLDLGVDDAGSDGAAEEDLPPEEELPPEEDMDATELPDLSDEPDLSTDDAGA